MDDAPVEHSVECGNLVNSHRWHFQHFGDIVHNTDARPALVLTLRQVKQGNDSSLLILCGIMGNDVLCPLQVFCVEFKGYLVSNSF
jgi:hypothetical protein